MSYFQLKKKEIFSLTHTTQKKKLSSISKSQLKKFPIASRAISHKLQWDHFPKQFFFIGTPERIEYYQRKYFLELFHLK